MGAKMGSKQPRRENLKKVYNHHYYSHYRVNLTGNYDESYEVRCSIIDMDSFYCKSFDEKEVSQYCACHNSTER